MGGSNNREGLQRWALGAVVIIVEVYEGGHSSRSDNHRGL